MDKQIRQFLEYLELERGHSQLTIRNYESYLLKFAEFAKENSVSSVDSVDLELVRKWRLALHRQMTNGRPISNKTINYYMIALRSFLKYLSKMDIGSLAPEKMELADTPERQIQFLEKEELVRLLDAFSGPDELELRNRAILETLFSTGLRVSELAHLSRENVNLKRGEFSVTGKGGKARVVFLSDNARYWIEKYIKTRVDRDTALFVKSADHPSANKLEAKKFNTSGGKLSDTGLGLTSRQIERVVKEAAKRAGIVKKVTPHVLRHSFATDILRAGADLRSVQALLGHTSVTTTQVYTHVTDKHLREIHKKFHDNKNGD